MLSCRRPPRRRQAARPQAPTAPEPATPAVSRRAVIDQPRRLDNPAGSHLGSRRVGIPAVDEVIRAVVNRDSDGLSHLMDFIDADCERPSATTSPGFCVDIDPAPLERTAGTRLGVCRDGSSHRDQPTGVTSLMDPDSALVVVFGLVQLQTPEGGLRSGYSIILEQPGRPWVAHVAATGGVLSVDFGCELADAAALIGSLPADKAILPPPGGTPPSPDDG